MELRRSCPCWPETGAAWCGWSWSKRSDGDGPRSMSGGGVHFRYASRMQFAILRGRDGPSVSALLTSAQRRWSTPCPRTRRLPNCGSATSASWYVEGDEALRANRASRCAPASTTRSRRPVAALGADVDLLAASWRGLATCAIGSNAAPRTQPRTRRWGVGARPPRRLAQERTAARDGRAMSAACLRARRGPEAHPRAAARPRPRSATGRGLGRARAHPPAHGRPAALAWPGMLRRSSPTRCRPPEHRQAGVQRRLGIG